jgi:hypothetical protein
MSTSDTITLLVGIMQFLATALIAWVVFRQTTLLKRAELQNDAINAFNTLNTTALVNDENLVTFDSLGRADIKEPIDLRRKRWCAFIWLEALQATYLGGHHGVLDANCVDRAIRQQLELILKDDLVYWLVVNRGFHPAFIACCSVIRAKVAPDRPKEMNEAEACGIRSDGAPHPIIRTAAQVKSVLPSS